MNLLATLTASTARAKTLALLFGNSREYYLREIERETSLSVGSIQHEVRVLGELGLIHSRRDGNRLYFRANRAHPIYPELRRIVLKTSGWMTELRELLAREDVKSAFIFGSIARGDENPESDVDLFVVGSIGLRALTALTGAFGRKTGREINPHLIAPAEWKRRIAAGDHFVTSVMASEKLFLVGSKGELEGMGR